MQGLAQSYAYNQIEATANFQKAIDADPKCAMCYWGLAYAVGPNLNKYNLTEEEAEAGYKGNQ